LWFVFSMKLFRPLHRIEEICSQGLKIDWRKNFLDVYNLWYELGFEKPANKLFDEMS